MEHGTDAATSGAAGAGREQCADEAEGIGATGSEASTLEYAGLAVATPSGYRATVELFRRVLAVGVGSTTARYLLVWDSSAEGTVNPERPFRTRRGAFAMQHQILQETEPTTTCDDGDSFTITAPDAPIIEGCYSAVDGYDIYGYKTYSQTGTDECGQGFVGIFKSEDTTTGEEIYLWVVVYSVSAIELDIYCVAVDEATANHPADADTWGCDLDQDLEFSEAAEDDFDADCGCY